MKFFQGILSLVLFSFYFSGCSGDSSKSKELKDPEPEVLDPIKYVDPFIGSGGKGAKVASAYVGAAAPFGMIKPSPDTRGDSGANPVFHCSGYHYDDNWIKAFSQLHAHGMGVPEYGTLGIMPAQGLTENDLEGFTWHSKFKKENEKTQAGLYSVVLDKYNLKVDITATSRAALYRYKFTKTRAAKSELQMIVDMGHTIGGKEAKVNDVKHQVWIDKKSISGEINAQNSYSGRSGGYILYFYMTFKDAIDGATPFKDAHKKKDRGLLVSQGRIDESMLKIGISFVSVQNAQENLEKEIPNWDFDAVLKSTQDNWRQNLNRIKLSGGTVKQKRIFYTAFYHSLLMPTLFTDVNGQYRGFDKKVHKTTGFQYYSDFSLWDTFRTLHPLLIITHPKRSVDMLKSLLKMKEQGGHIPKWPLALGYSNGMLGTPADHFFAGAHLKGLRGFDIETAYEDLKNVAMGKKDKNSKYSGRNGIKNYMDKGYVASEDAKVSASRTLEFSFNDFALANLAKALDKKDDAETFLKRSKNYKNIWDKDKSFFRAKKKDGSWAYDFNEEAYFQPDYVEGNARQFLWFVPHDPEGLFELLGGKEKSLERLNKFFEDSKVLHEENQKNDLKKLLPNFYYWHGNEPSIHAALFFSDLGRQDLLTKWLRWIQNSLYDVTPDGLAGNDDAGTLSAWYILTSIGLYPIPGSDQYYLTTPIFDEVEISSSPDKSLKIINKAFLKFGIRSISSAKVGDKSISLKPKHSEIFAEKKAVLTFE